MSLLLDVSDLEREVGQVLKFSLAGEADDFQFPGGGRLGRIAAEGRALWTGDTVLVEGTARAASYLTCSRCLGAFQGLVETAFSREFVPAQDGPGPGDGRGGGGQDRSRAAEGRYPDISRDPAEQPVIFQGQVIDLTFTVWEALVLELPMKPVCRETCAGLCPVCGTDLNTMACGCEAERADPRLLPLKELLSREERGE